MRTIWDFCLSFCAIVLVLLSSSDANAGELAERLENFPQWEKLTHVKPATGDLVYPSWMAGDWLVQSTLVDLAAPLAPDIVTPGFDGNRQYLNQPISFKVKFVTENKYILGLSSSLKSGSKLIPRTINQTSNKPRVIVADRAYNGLSLARAYLGDEAVLSVKVDPESPNRQVTLLRGDKQLVSIVTARAVETTDNGKYLTTEVFQQLFQDGKKQTNPYFNNVESTTAYRLLSSENSATNFNPQNPIIEADQVTAVYLSPQDANYFKAGSRPVALYRYKLEFRYNL
jgi:hypothetical protein